MENVRICILPRSPSRRSPVGLAVACILLFVLSEVLIGFQVLGPENNHALATVLTIILAGMAGGTFTVGIISVAKSRERSFLVFLVTAIGLDILVGATVSLLGLPK